MAIKARWSETDVVVPVDDDPFQARVEQIGLPIVLTAPFAQLNERLIELVQIEGRLFNRGVRCAVKDRDDTSCNACPLSAHESKTDPLGELCRCGREQELVATQMAVGREAERAGS